MKSTDEITNCQDIIDSRDVIARIEYLESEREAAFIEPENREAFREEQSREPFIAENGDELWPNLWDEEQEEELTKLRALADEASGYAADWTYGEALIRDSYFEEYARDMAEDIGAIPKDTAWPCTCIDWAQAARELQSDYTAVNFDGTTYWIC